MVALPVPTLVCPLRGPLKTAVKAKDGLTYTEEKLRIDLIRHILSLGYAPERIRAETQVFRIGHAGKNSLRADVVVYDRAWSDISGLSSKEQREHAIMLGEVKRDSSSADSAKQNQLIPALRLLPRNGAIGIYWDDVEQVIFLKVDRNGRNEEVEASIALIPRADAGAADAVHFQDLKPVQELTKKFALLDDTLHRAGISKDVRYDVLYKFLLLKIFDENHARATKAALIYQDYSLSPWSDDEVKTYFEDQMERTLHLYGHHLPKPLDKHFACNGATIREIAKHLCMVNILDSSPQVLQDFFMYFGRFIYKVELGQHFTPYEVIDLIVRIVNPKFGEQINDPACGTADFPVGCKRVAQERHGVDISAQLHGTDAAGTAVNLSVFNLVLNGVQNPQVNLGDSLKEIKKQENLYSVVLCNPPFGAKIVEKRSDVLRLFDMGTESGQRDTRDALKSQEMGVLFVEACLRMVKPGGRVGIILPNGYLGNAGSKYVSLRQWIVKHAKVIAVIGFPRFTFKRSGADVSTSVLIMERRKSPLQDASAARGEPVHFNLVERVGWDLQSKRAGRIWKRDAATGAIVLGADNEPIPDADFDRVLQDLYASDTFISYGWISEGVNRQAVSNPGHAIDISDLVALPDLCLDPKRWSAKHLATVRAIQSTPHFRIGDVLEPVVRKLRKSAETKYRYVEIEKIYENFGVYVADEYFGWQMPDRGKQVAVPGDVFIANIWSSAGKWLIAGRDAADGKLIVTTGCTQFTVKEGMDGYVEDLVFGLSSEAFRVQMRARATGSDGLSSISTDNILDIVLPKIPTPDVRSAIAAQLKASRAGQLVLQRVVRETLATEMPSANIAPRWSHVVQV
ncbi:HsdM family class I SAM-dependent methyltransferase [Paraburkholderia atlantica]|uniref:HsdM family class I SAM-dependent methyltransferase n=1 Tax=Paraburkholderia atlantica TaxID=2654982 RepID=UPI00161DE1A2|nr:N-6 DNA methylase [Paraburkholderia atlantica]MBB5508721.1 type I restriction enzyme M protein [Paraburkholderia atlantica]